MASQQLLGQYYDKSYQANTINYYGISNIFYAGCFCNCFSKNKLSFRNISEIAVKYFLKLKYFTKLGLFCGRQKQGTVPNVW